MMRMSSAALLLGLFATCACVSAAAASGGFPSGVPFAPRGGAAAAAATAATKAKKSSKTASSAAATSAVAAAHAAARHHPQESSTAPLSQAAELTPEDEPLLRDIQMLSDMLEEVVKKDDPEADALYRKFRGLGLDR